MMQTFTLIAPLVVAFVLGIVAGGTVAFGVELRRHTSREIAGLEHGQASGKPARRGRG